MTFPATDIATRAGDILQDASATRWTSNELLRWINDGQNEIVKVVPRANTLTENITCVAGARQTIPATSVRLMLVSRNMGDDGNTPGKAITLIPRRELEAFRPNWQNDAAKSKTDHFMFDERDAKVFWVYPPANTQKIEVVTSVMPVPLTSLSDTVGVDDEFKSPMLDYVLYRAFSKETELGAQQRSKDFLTLFTTGIGTKLASDIVEPDKTGVI